MRKIEGEVTKDTLLWERVCMSIQREGRGEKFHQGMGGPLTMFNRGEELGDMAGDEKELQIGRYS